MNTLPQRFSEKAFRRYEHVIAQITKDFPKAVYINPSDLGLAGETVRGRLRDAITSYSEHHWESKFIDQPSFFTIPAEILVVSLRPNGMVVVGTKETIKGIVNEVFTAAETKPCFDLSNSVDTETLSFLCFLAHSQLLNRPILLTLTENQQETYMKMYDIMLEKQSDGRYLLI